MRVTQRERWRGSAQRGKPNAQPPARRDCRFVADGALSARLPLPPGSGSDVRNVEIVGAGEKLTPFAG
jgi:hypothetical protein